MHGKAAKKRSDLVRSALPSRFSTSTVLGSKYLVPWLAAQGPLAYSPVEPPPRDYFFQYSWILPGIFDPKVNLREHRHWERLREIADDRDKLDDTYEDWQRQALTMIHDLEAVGRQIRKVPIDIEALFAWCRERKCRIDMVARAEYVSYLLSQAEKVGEPSR